MRRHSLRPIPRPFLVLSRIVLFGISFLFAFPAGAQETLDPDSPPPVRDYVSCGHFETQADAQAYFDTRELELPEVLDADGDGIACEDAFLDHDSPPPAMDYTASANAEVARPTEPAPAAVRLPKTGTGTDESGSATPWAIAFVLTSGMALVVGHRFRRERGGR